MSTSTAPSVFRSVMGLGEPICVYKSGSLDRWIRLVAAAFLLLLGIYMLFTDLRLFGILLVLAMLIWAGLTLRRWFETAVVYEDGLAHYDGKKILVYKWIEIASIAMQVTVFSYYGLIKYRTTHRYTITHLNGKKLKLDDNLPKVAELFDQIRERTFQPILVRSCQAFDMGDTVQFGAFALSQSQGIIKGTKICPWPEVGPVLLNAGTVTIKRKGGGWFSDMSAPIDKVLNPDVFLAMAREMTQTSN